MKAVYSELFNYIDSLGIAPCTVIYVVSYKNNVLVVTTDYCLEFPEVDDRRLLCRRGVVVKSDKPIIRVPTVFEDVVVSYRYAPLSRSLEYIRGVIRYIVDKYMRHHGYKEGKEVKRILEKLFGKLVVEASFTEHPHKIQV